EEKLAEPVMSEYERWKAHVLEDPEVREEYDRLGPLYGVISQVLRLRHERGLSQKDLAERMGKQQPAIARFETGRVEPSLSFLQQLAEALDMQLTVLLEPKQSPRRTARVAEEPARYTTDGGGAPRTG
ncbi:MAG TPA: helix-turn-helix transcriptional regulator, partial [Dehalococcoidia bacterium]|nr:helix-turn-helix transcriptional regulator [Dehalococcoidia bacterium]